MKPSNESMANGKDFHNDLAPGVPCFIVSPMNRSGTNFLADILVATEEFELPMLTEDYLLEHSYHLVNYVDKNRSRWHRKLTDVQCRESLRFLGDGLLRFVSSQTNRTKRLILKTPRPYGLHNFPSLFPSARLILLVRDGRDVVESASRTWAYRGHVGWAKQWAKGARELLKFMKDYSDLQDNQWRLVRYEDILRSPEPTLGSLFEFLSLETNGVDYNALANQPLRGSSTHRGSGPTVNWEQVAKPADFNPTKRWDSWSLWKQALFRICAGRELSRLGYA